MQDFLNQATGVAEMQNGATVFVRLVLAFIFGAAVAWIYRRSLRAGEVSATLPTTLVLLAILIAMVTQVIGDNVARAFSLVGALSIVRFRTVVRDTRDTAFVIFAVVIGMAIGSSYAWVALIGLVVVGAAAYIMNKRRNDGLDESHAYELNLRMGLGSEVEALVRPVLNNHMISLRMLAIGTPRQGVSINVTYEGRLKPSSSPEEIVKALNRVEGVQGVELRRQFTQED